MTGVDWKGQKFMGCVSTITKDCFPKQGAWLGKTVEVCFHYDTKSAVRAQCIRDDREEPFQTVFLCEDGRVVLGTECQHTGPISLDDGDRE